MRYLYTQHSRNELEEHPPVAGEGGGYFGSKRSVTVVLTLWRGR